MEPKTPEQEAAPTSEILKQAEELDANEVLVDMATFVPDEKHAPAKVEEPEERGNSSTDDNPLDALLDTDSIDESFKDILPSGEPEESKSTNTAPPERVDPFGSI